jgi:alpha-mannosidase
MIKRPNEILAPQSLGNRLEVFEDKPLQHDAWDIDIYYQEKMKKITNLQEIKITEEGPIRCAIEFL